LLILLLAEAELEKVPEDIKLHPSVVTHAKKRGKRSRTLILDSSLHHSAMKKLEDRTRRGRPDLVHTFLLVALESIPNLEGELRVVVHTRGDLLLDFDPGIRLPKNYNRFVGLIEQLFETGVVPKECLDGGKKPLIELKKEQTVPIIVDDLRKRTSESGNTLRVIRMSEGGVHGNISTLFPKPITEGEDQLIILGGFPDGEFKFDPDDIEPFEDISIHKEKLKVWTVAAEILAHYRASITKTAGGEES